MTADRPDQQGPGNAGHPGVDFSEHPSEMSSGVRDPLVGTVLNGEYAILDLIGQGAMARVYKAKQLSVDRFVAIKVLQTDDEEPVARFQHEVKLHSQLKHKNIVQAIDCLSGVDGRTYFVMEYLNGMSLQDLIRTQGPLTSATEVMSITEQICDALAFAHNIGIIHRDLKPGNIVLLDQHGEVVVKVVDFGMARVSQSLQRMTKAGTVVGSPIYMSPEQCMGLEVDARSDVYSLGILLYELVTGKPAYNFGRLVETMKAHCDPNTIPESVLERVPEIPGGEALDQILRASVETNPDNRFQTTGELKEAIRSWFNGIKSGASGFAIKLPSAAPEPAQSQPVRSNRPTSDLTDEEHSSLQALVSRQLAGSSPEGKDLEAPKGFQPQVLDNNKASFTGADLDELAMGESLVGKTLNGRYKVLDQLGQGNMAVVYRALRLDTQELVAIKTLKFNDPELVQRFSREVTIHSRLAHRNIVKAIECFDIPNGPSCFVMELLAGTNLEDYIFSSSWKSDINVISELIAQLCFALSHAHEHGVIHRDLKPENVIVIERPGSIKAKVLDFGVAKIQEDLQRLTKTGIVLGSPAYMSPEQCMGDKLTPASDLYSLGILAYELFTGNLPFVAEDQVSMMEAHCDPSSKAMPIANFRKDLSFPKELDKVFAKLLEVDSQRRYQSVAELLHELDRWWHKEIDTDADAISPFFMDQAAATMPSLPAVPDSASKPDYKTENLNDLISKQRYSQAMSVAKTFEEGSLPGQNKGKSLIVYGVVLLCLLGVGFAVMSVIGEKSTNANSNSSGSIADTVEPIENVQNQSQSESQKQGLRGSVKSRYGEGYYKQNTDDPSEGSPTQTIR